MTERNITNHMGTAASGPAMHVAAIATLKPGERAMRPPARRAAVYARVPTGTAGASNEARQITECRIYALATGLRVVATFSEEGPCRRREHRLDLLQLMQAARDGDIDACVVADLHRLAREPSDLLAIFEELDRHGVELHEVHGGRIEHVHVVIRGWMAAMARDRFVERCRAGRRRAALERKGVKPAAC